MEQMVRSIQAQTYTNWELLISAVDSPTDDTYRVAAALAAADDRIVVQREKAPGFAVNVNATFEMSMGSIIFRQEADDWSEPNRLHLQVSELQRGFDLVSCGMVRVMRDGTRRLMDVGCMKPEEFVTLSCPRGPGSDSIVAWRHVYELVGLYDPTYDASADTDWSFRALAVEPPLQWSHIPLDLYVYRDHPEQMTKRLYQPGADIHLERQAFYRERIMEIVRKYK
jgi:glycosyltransferase involved in cell wall biosynthesis